MRSCARGVGECHVDGVGPVVWFCQACSSGISHILAHIVLCHLSCLTINIAIPPILGFFLFLGVWLVANHGVLPGSCALVWEVPRFFCCIHIVHSCSFSIGRVQV